MEALTGWQRQGYRARMAAVPLGHNPYAEGQPLAIGISAPNRRTLEALWAQGWEIANKRDFAPKLPWPYLR